LEQVPNVSDESRDLDRRARANSERDELARQVAVISAAVRALTTMRHPGEVIAAPPGSRGSAPRSSSFDDACRRADLAMYEAKRSGGMRYRLAPDRDTALPPPRCSSS
jgi:GGDEF domain-containing protein